MRRSPSFQGYAATVLIALGSVPVACSSSSAPFNPPLPQPDAAADATTDDGGDDSAGDDAAMFIDDSTAPPVDGELVIPPDGALTVGSPCDPMNSACPSPLMCCHVSGNVKDGGVFYACMRLRDGGCP